MPEIGDVVAEKYRVESLIGEGGMGAVFAASHALTGKRVALKWLRPELAANEAAVRRFMREAQAAGRIDHPNVVDIYDVGQHEGSTFLVMEFLLGEPLSARIARGPVDVGDALATLLPAMRGVAAAHATGVVHRDLKPDNIFLCRGPDGTPREPKVLDFGISKVSSHDGQNLRLTRTGAVMGTPYYMSPEQIRAAEIDQRTDVYAFGVMLYETLTGRVPFDGESYSSLVLNIATGTPLPIRQILPGLPSGLERVVQKAMAREPADRFPDVASLVRALEPYASGMSFSTERREPTGGRRTFESTTPFASESAPPRVPVRRSALAWVLGGAVVLVAVALLALYLSKPAQPTAAGPSAPPEPHVVQPAPAAAEPAPAPAPSGGLAGSAAAPVAGAVPVAMPAPAGGAAAPVPPAVAGQPALEPKGRRPGVVQPTAPLPPVPPATAPGVRPNGRTGGLRADEF